MTGELPIGNDFITKNWYDLNLFEKFGYLPDYKNDEKELLSDLALDQFHSRQLNITLSRQKFMSHKL